MSKIARRFRKAFRSNAKGFTLIELLVVIGILAVIGGIVALNVGQFIGRGCAESARIELHNVQTATVAYMADNDGDIPADEAALDAFLIGGSDNLKGDYTIDQSTGEVTQDDDGCD
ncbi:MAG: type II secretion system protein [Chloroflexi bacterium]|nr:type II secretion system protein [Chloroflexota bacterium]